MIGWIGLGGLDGLNGMDGLDERIGWNGWIEGVDDVGPIVAHHIRGFASDERNQRVISDLLALGVNWPTVKVASGEGPLAGTTWVVTGKLESMSRGDAEQRLRVLGARTASSVSAKTSTVLAGMAMPKNPGRDGECPFRYQWHSFTKNPALLRQPSHRAKRYLVLSRARAHLTPTDTHRPRSPPGIGISAAPATTARTVTISAMPSTLLVGITTCPIKSWGSASRMPFACTYQ